MYRKNLVLIIIILAGFIFHLSINIPFGITHKFADIYRARDELWQIALAQTAFKTWPFQMPNFAGAQLSGYHILFSFLLSTLTRISPLISFYIFIPLIWLILYLLISYILIRQVTTNQLTINLFIFFQLFAGCLTYFFSIFHQLTLFGSDALGYQSSTLTTNYPLAFSLITFMGIIYLLKSPRSHYYLLLLLLIFSWGFKFYAGIMALILIIFRKPRLIMISLLVSAFSIFIFYNPLASQSHEPLFYFRPFALVHSLIENSDQFYLPKIANARYFLYSTGKIGPRLIFIEEFTTLLYLLFSAGTRLLGLIYLIYKLIRKYNYIDLILLLTFIASFLLAILLIQKGDWFNPMQFLIYGYLILNLYTAIFLTKLWSKSKILVILIILLTIPDSLNTLHKYLTPFSDGPVYISQPEVSALKFLKQQLTGVVYTLPFSSESSSAYKANQPLWVSEDSSYVPAFTGKLAYFTHLNQMILTGISYQSRQQQLFTNPGSLPVQYYYLLKSHPSYNQVLSNLQQNNITQIYENSEVIVLKKL